MNSLAINVGGYAPVLFIGGFIAVAAIVLGIGFYANKKRKEAIEKLAADKGWDFDHKGRNYGTSQDLPKFSLFKKRGVSGIKSVVYGQEAGLDVAIGDYTYSTGSGKNRKTVSQTFCIIGLPGKEGEQVFPDFVLGPEHVFHFIAEMVGFKDIDFDDYPTFSKKYRLTSDNELAVRELFTPAVIEYFEKHLDRRRQLEAHGRWLMLYRTGQRRKVEEWDGLYNESLSVMDGLMQGRG